jgi:hypothetical protein
VSHQKEVKKLKEDAEAQGWTAIEKKNGWMMRSPDGEGQVMLHKTPNSNGVRHYIRDLRKYGYRPGGR